MTIFRNSTERYYWSEPHKGHTMTCKRIAKSLAETSKLLRDTAVNVLCALFDFCRYGKALPPMGRPVMINPNTIAGFIKDSKTGTCKKPMRRGLSRVKGGDWDKSILATHPRVLLYENYFRSRRLSADRDNLFQELRALGLSPAGTKKSVAKCDDLYESIVRHGFRPDFGRPDIRWLPLSLRRLIPEGVSCLQIAIARDGSILKSQEGAHRLAIALALEMPSVPAQICLIHKDAVTKKSFCRR